MDLKKIYIGYGMVRRGDEIWQYFMGSEEYHSPWVKQPNCETIFRAVQRFDGFVSADTPYQGGSLTTRPLAFRGNRLILNIDTGATGFAQVGVLDEHGVPIPGFELDSCVYVNGNHIETEVEWLDRGADVGELAGRTVKLVFRSRGTKLYSMQFVNR